MRQDVDKLLAGPEDSEKEFYILAALSDLQNTLDFALHLFKGKRKTSTRPSGTRIIIVCTNSDWCYSRTRTILKLNQ